MKAAWVLLRWEVGSAGRWVSVGWGCLFFLAVVVLLPLGVGSEAVVLERLAVGFLWIAVLLASLCGLDGMFRPAWEDGSLEAMALSDVPLEAAALVVCGAHWVTHLLPLAVLCVPCGVLLGLEWGEAARLAGVVACLSPALSLLGGVGAVLSLDARRGGMLSLLLVLPLEVPVLVFGVFASGGDGGSFVLGLGLALLFLAATPFLVSVLLWARLRV